MHVFVVASELILEPNSPGTNNSYQYLLFPSPYSTYCRSHKRKFRSQSTLNMGLKSALKKVAQKSSKSPRRTRMLTSKSSPSDPNVPSNQPIQILYRGNKEFGTKGDINFRILAFAGGVSIVLTSLLSIGICIYDIDFLDMMIYFYSLSFGLLICILEGHFIQSDKVHRIREAATDGLPVLKYLWGRGVLYVLSGSLQLSHLDSMNFLSGAFLIGVGILFISVGMHSRKRLRKLKKVLKDSKKLKQQFHKYDKDGDGFLDLDEFGAFVANLTGEDMDEDELEGTFGYVDTSGKGYLTLEDLQAWFSGFKEAEDYEETGGTNNAFQLL